MMFGVTPYMANNDCQKEYKLWCSELDGPGGTRYFFKNKVEGVPKPMILVLASLILKYMGGFMQKNCEKSYSNYF